MLRGEFRQFSVERLLRFLVALDGGALAPLGVEHVDPETQPLRHVDPQMAEHAEARGDDPVPRAQGIGERGLPGARAARREDVGLARGGLEDLLEVLQHRGRELREIGRPVVLHRDVHGAEDAVGRIRGTRDEEEVAAGHAGTLAAERKDGTETRRLRRI